MLKVLAIFLNGGTCSSTILRKYLKKSQKSLIVPSHYTTYWIQKKSQNKYWKPNPCKTQTAWWRASNRISIVHILPCPPPSTPTDTHTHTHTRTHIHHDWDTPLFHDGELGSLDANEKKKNEWNNRKYTKFGYLYWAACWQIRINEFYFIWPYFENRRRQISISHIKLCQRLCRLGCSSKHTDSQQPCSAF